MLYKSPYGKHFTWVYSNYSPDHKSHTVCFQWLMWQGSEFRVICSSKLEMIGILTLLADAISTKHTPVSVRIYDDKHGNPCYEFETEVHTITPGDVKRICGDYLNIELTPITAKTREILESGKTI
ncbi:MAG: hypothetical protein WA061_01875 [Microgenomates group bacterium]